MCGFKSIFILTPTIYHWQTIPPGISDGKFPVKKYCRKQSFEKSLKFAKHPFSLSLSKTPYIGLKFYQVHSSLRFFFSLVFTEAVIQSIYNIKLSILLMRKVLNVNLPALCHSFIFVEFFVAF
jgi:hypothetical protein